MSLLGEISKNSEALRYHAKTAEVAGQNLAHVNDETYARQRVLAREGVMHKAFGGLLTSGLEAGGVEHARNELLDRRVINEVGEGKSLAAQKEILELLQILNHDHGKTILMVTHDPVAAESAKRTLHLDKGKLTN